MSIDSIIFLITNVGLAGTLVVWFVVRDSKRESAAGIHKEQLELFIRETLLKIIEENAALLRENQLILSRCVSIIELVETSDENTAD